MAHVYRFVKECYQGQENYYCPSGAETGDMVQWDATSRYATNAVIASGSIFLGVALDGSPLRSLGTVDNPLTGFEIVVKAQGIFDFLSTNGETYSHGDPVFASGKQTITKVSASRCIGRVHLPLGTQISGDGVKTVPVQILGASLCNGGTVPSSAVK